MSDQSPSAEELRTDRLVLRRPTTADIDAILAVHSDPAACFHNPSDALTRFEEAEGLYKRWDEQWGRYGYGYWVVRSHESAQQLGFCGIKPMKLGEVEVLNLFYRFAPSTWGRGLAAESASAVTAWASRHLPETPLIARIRPSNVPSQRVALRSGLTRARHLDTEGYDGFDWIYVAQPEHWPA
jgi:RimJ/RimL family protein N-acetyltransferase